MTEENGYRGARALLGLAEPPTAIVCSSMIMALGIVRATRELGLDIPRDLSLVAHDDVFHYLKPESFPVPLTTTRSSIRAAASFKRCQVRRVRVTRPAPGRSATISRWVAVSSSISWARAFSRESAGIRR